MKRIFDENQIKEYLKKYKLDEVFDDKLIKESQLHYFSKDEYVMEADTDLNYYYLLAEGKVKVSYLFENGKPYLLKFYSGCTVLGDIELLKNSPVRCNVEAVTDCVLIAVPAITLRNSYSENPKFLRHLLDSLSDKLYATINNSSYNYVYPLVNRLASYLNEFTTDEDFIKLDTSYKDVAQFLGTTYRHLSRTLRELEAENIIRCEGKKIYIIDKKRLLELSKNPFIKSV